MPHLSPLYRFLTVLYAVFGFGPNFLRFWMMFSFGFAVSNIPQCPRRLGFMVLRGKDETTLKGAVSVRKPKYTEEHNFKHKKDSDLLFSVEKFRRL